MNDIKYFKNLDSLRFIAFIFVFFSHLGPKIYLPKDHNLAFLNVFFQHGRTAVSFFFILSGFLITYLLIKERFSTHTIHLKSFFIKRILRILPLYFIVCLIGFLFFPFFYGITTNESFLQHIFLGANFNQIELANNNMKNSMILAPLWSIAIEEQFYLFWPFFLLFIKPRYYLHLFLIVLLSAYIFMYLNLKSYVTLILHTFSVLPEFMLGAIIAFLTYHNSIIIQWIKELPKWFIILGYFISIFIILYLPSPYNYFAYPFIFTFIILEQVFSKNSLLKVSSIKGLDYLGKISYGCYMFHSIILFVMMYFFTHFDLFTICPFLSKMAFVILSLLLTISVSYLSYNYIEKYFLNLRKLILKR